MDNLPPGRLGMPFLGESLRFIDNPYEFFETRYRAHGPVFKTRLFGDNVICLVGPEAFSFFYDDRWFTRRSASPPQVREILHPDAIPFLDGDDRHARRRRLLLRAFEADAVDAYQPTIERIVERYLARWLAGGEVSGVAELGKMCFTVGNALFAGNDPDTDDDDMEQVFAQVMGGMFALPINLPFTGYGKALRARDRMRRYVADAVGRYRPGSADHVLERVLTAADPDGSTLSRDEVQIELLHFFGAAHAALQAALCAGLRLLAQHPDVAERGRAEVAAAAPTGPLGARLAGLAHVHRIGLEVRRCQRIAPSTFLATVKQDCEFRGHRIPAGWKAMAVTHSTMNDDAVFPDAARFDPDRYAPGRAEDDKQPNSWVPHGGGPWSGHRCAGEALATRVIDVFHALALRRTRWTLPSQDLSDKLAGLSMLPRDGLRIRFTPAAADTAPPAAS